MKRVYQEDIVPCLSFSDDCVNIFNLYLRFLEKLILIYLKKVSEDLLISIETNCVCIEDLTNSQLSYDSLPQ